VITSAGVATGQRLVRSTYDWEQPVSGNWGEVWSDVKTPGDGRTYRVGTTQTSHTDAGVFALMFSGVDTGMLNANLEGPPGMPDAANKIVVVLQATDMSGTILWQRFFHGRESPGNPFDVPSTYGRSIAVHPAATPLETRIAVCGETFCWRLPLTPDRTQLATGSAGFIAVYNGNGLLLWTKLFYGHDDASTVITDVAIHAAVSGGIPVDVVTYCGLSANGVFSGSGARPLDPLRPFPPPGPVVPAPCTNTYAGGDAVNHPSGNPALASNQWDGIVGRLQVPHGASPGVIPTHLCHSIVGGYPDWEGLFGIAEKNENEFAVVGTIQVAGTAMPDTRFPLTRPEWRGTPICIGPGPAGAFGSHGVIVEFDASAVAQGGPLILKGSTLIGGDALGVNTVARDVLCQGGLYYVVGSTNGDGFDINQVGPTVAPSPGESHGYVLVTGDTNAEFLNGMYFANVAVGVGGWNEYPDHVAVFGLLREVLPTSPPSFEHDFVVASLFRDTCAGGQDALLLTLRQHRIVAPGNQVVDAIDPDNSTGAATGFTSGLYALGTGPNWVNPFPLGGPGGGGVSVDARGNVTIVGCSDSTGYPVFPPVPMPGMPNPNISRDASALISTNSIDAVTSVIDLLPDGVFRSDGTGDPALNWGPTGNGGTTPACALSSFGSLIGVTPPALKRIFLDFEGEPLAGGSVGLLVDRPPPTSSVLASIWRLGAPLPTPWYQFPHDVEMWIDPLTDPPFVAALPTGGSTRQVFTGVPQGFSYLVQYLCLLATPLAGTPCAGTDLTWAASPAMLFSH